MGIRIAELPDSDTLSDTDLSIVQDNTSTKKATLGQMKKHFNQEVLDILNDLGLSVDDDGYIVQEVEDE